MTTEPIASDLPPDTAIDATAADLAPETPVLDEPDEPNAPEPPAEEPAPNAAGAATDGRRPLYRADDPTAVDSDRWERANFDSSIGEPLWHYVDDKAEAGAQAQGDGQDGMSVYFGGLNAR